MCYKNSYVTLGIPHTNTKTRIDLLLRCTSTTQNTPVHSHVSQRKHGATFIHSLFLVNKRKNFAKLQARATVIQCWQTSWASNQWNLARNGTQNPNENRANRPVEPIHVQGIAFTPVLRVIGHCSENLTAPIWQN